MEVIYLMFWMAIACLGIVGLVAVMVFKYFVKFKFDQQGQLIGKLGRSDEERSKRLEVIEKKNGHEQHQIDDLKKMVFDQQKHIERLEMKVEQLEKIIIKKDGQIEGLKMALKG